MNAPHPLRGEVWLIDLDPTRGHEQAGRRPCVVVSATPFNRSPAGLAVVVPMTSSQRSFPFRVEVLPPEGGLRQASYVICESIRSVATERFIVRWGTLDTATMSKIEDRTRTLLAL